MSDVPVYMIVNLKVTDSNAYRNYEKGFFPFLKKYDGQFVTYDDQPETLEGNAPLDGRAIIFTFPNEEKARTWYDDAGYQELSEHRRAGTELRFLTLVRGMPPRK